MVIDKFFILKFLKFGVVGFSGVFVYFGITYLFKEIIKINSENADVATEYGKFMLVSAIGLGINSLTLYLLTDKLKWNFYLSKIFAIGMATLWNFFANLLFTFK